MVLGPIEDGLLPNQEIDVEAAQRLVDTVPKRYQRYIALSVVPTCRLYHQDGSFTELPMSYSQDEEGYKWSLTINIAAMKPHLTLTSAIAEGLACAYYTETHHGSNSSVIQDLYERRRARLGEPGLPEEPTYEQRKEAEWRACSFWMDEVGRYENLFLYRTLEAQRSPELRGQLEADVKEYWERLEADLELAHLIQFYRDIKDGKYCVWESGQYVMRVPAPRPGPTLPRMIYNAFPDLDVQVAAAQKLLDSVPEPYHNRLLVHISKKVVVDHVWFEEVLPVTFGYGEQGLWDVISIGHETVLDMGWSLTQALAKGIARELFEDWPTGANRSKIVALSNLRAGPLDEKPDPFFEDWHGERLAAAKWWCDEVAAYEHLFTYRALAASRADFETEVEAYRSRVEADPLLGELIELYRGIVGG